VAFSWESFEQMGDNVKTNLKQMRRDGVNRIELAHDKEQWRALVFHKRQGISLPI
jgi:hypothetical protein